MDNNIFVSSVSYSKSGRAGAAAVLSYDAEDGKRYNKIIKMAFPQGGAAYAAKMICKKALQLYRNPTDLIIWTDNDKLALFISNQENPQSPATKDSLEAALSFHGINAAFYLDSACLDMETADPYDKMLLTARNVAEYAVSVMPSYLDGTKCPKCQKGTFRFSSLGLEGNGCYAYTITEAVCPVCGNKSSVNKTTPWLAFVGS